MHLKSALAHGLVMLPLLTGCPAHQQARPPPPPPAAPDTRAEPLSTRPSPARPPMTTGRLIDSGLILETFAAHFGSKDIKQVPSEVVETGMFRHVPYLSYESSQFELNIYGDPLHPAGVEIGVYASKTPTKQEIRDTVARLLQQAADRELVHRLSLEQDRMERAGLTFEVTPPTADDAFGGWWISIYDAAAIQAGRASDDELKVISVKPDHPARQAAEEIRRPAHKKQEEQRNPERVYIPDYSKGDGVYVGPER